MTAPAHGASRPLTLDELIAALRHVKRADPRAGSKPVYAGETILTAAAAVQVGDDAVIPRDLERV